MSDEKPQSALRRNRRLSFRRSPKGKTKIACRKGHLDLGHNISVAVLDLSQTGAKLALKCELTRGAEVTLTLEGLNHPRPVRVLGDVVWCRADGDQWLAGVRFQKHLNYRLFIDLA